MNCLVCQKNQVNQDEVVCQTCLKGYQGYIPPKRDVLIYRALSQKAAYGANQVKNMASFYECSRSRIYQVRNQVQDFIDAVSAIHGVKAIKPTSKKSMNESLPGYYVTQELKNQVVNLAKSRGVKQPVIARDGINKILQAFQNGGVNLVKTQLQENQFEGPFPIFMSKFQIDPTSAQALKALVDKVGCTYSEVMRLALALMVN